jgi:FkbM family methyltransferase
MAAIARLISAVKGALWLVRAGGMRDRARRLEERLADLDAKLTNAVGNIHEAIEQSQPAAAPKDDSADINFANVQGHLMFLHAKDNFISPCLAQHGIWEPFETEIVKREVKRGDVVLDVGANIGYYTLLLARLVGETGKVYAFEPDAANFALLEKNVRVNRYQNVVLVNKAVSNKTDKVKLYICDINMGDHRLFEFPGQNRRAVEIETISLDEYFRDYTGKVDFIKMDIQGAEGAALEGMAGLLARFPQVKLLTEYSFHCLKSFGSDPEAYLQRLQAYGFQLLNVNEPEQRIEPAEIPAIMERYPWGKETNLLCVKAAA